MSHELRTPLNAILGFSEVMRDEVFGPLTNERYKSYARDINSSASHLVKVIAGILDLSRAEAGEITIEIVPAKIAHIVEMAVRLVEQRARDGNVTIEIAIDDRLAAREIATDEGKVTQILLNLLTNAIKFTKPGGNIVVAAVEAEGTMTITVRDTGIGIAAEDIERVMTPFGQVDSAYHAREGFGLGLPLSRKLSEKLGGSLTIDSQLGVGTTVIVRLPAAAASA
jgi:signal transduction histidine kinase